MKLCRSTVQVHRVAFRTSGSFHSKARKECRSRCREYRVMHLWGSTQRNTEHSLAPKWGGCIGLALVDEWGWMLHSQSSQSCTNQYSPSLGFGTRKLGCCKESWAEWVHVWRIWCAVAGSPSQFQALKCIAFSRDISLQALILFLSGEDAQPSLALKYPVEFLGPSHNLPASPYTFSFLLVSKSYMSHPGLTYMILFIPVWACV